MTSVPLVLPSENSVKQTFIFSVFTKKSVSNFLVPDFGKINLIFFFYTLFRTCMQKSADGVFSFSFRHTFFVKNKTIFRNRNRP